MPFRSLLERARQGDRTAWNTLLASLRPFLRAIVRRRGCPDDAASEFANDALLRIDQAFPRFRGTTSAELRAWSRMVVVNVVCAATPLARTTAPNDSSPAAGVSRERISMFQSKARSPALSSLSASKPACPQTPSLSIA